MHNIIYYDNILSDTIMPSNEQKCSVLNCISGIGILFHRFPAAPKRAVEWVQLCGNESLIGRTVHELSKCHYVCTNHFKNEDALPSIGLPAPIDVIGEEVEVKLPPGNLLNIKSICHTRILKRTAVAQHSALQQVPYQSSASRSVRPQHPPLLKSPIRSKPRIRVLECPTDTVVALTNQVENNNSGMTIELCEPPETTQVFSDEEDECQVQLESRLEYEGEQEFYYDCLCRTCGQLTKDATDIFSPDGVRQHLQYKINTNLPIKVVAEDMLSKSICGTCLTRLQACHLIRESSRRADIQLRAALATDNMLINYSPDLEMPNFGLIKQLKRKFAIITDLKSSEQMQSEPSHLMLPQVIDVRSVDLNSASNMTIATSPIPEHNYSSVPVGSFLEPSLNFGHVYNAPQTSTVDCDMEIEINSMPSPQFQDQISDNEEPSYICPDDPRESGAIFESQKSKNVHCSFSDATVTQNQISVKEEPTYVCPENDLRKSGEIFDNQEAMNCSISDATVTQNQVLGDASVLPGLECEPQQQKKKQVKKISAVKDTGFSGLPRNIKFHDTSAMSCTELADFMDKLEKDIELSKERVPEEEQIFTCSECCSSFIEEYQYNVHVHQHSIEKKWSLFTCYMCKLKFKSKYLLLQHKRSAHYQPKIFKCEPCNRTFNRNDTYQFHLNSIHSTNRFHCHLCPCTFVSKYDIKSHIKHHDKKRCAKCGKWLKNLAHMELHQSRPCSADDRRSNLQYHPRGGKKRERIANPGDIQKCPECHQQFENFSYMKRHVLHKHPDSPHYVKFNCFFREKEFSCQECHKWFVSKQQFKVHMNTHTKIILYDCPHCDKTSYHKQVMMTHIKTHSDNRPYACTYCDKKFKRRDALNSHTRTHTGEKPFACQYCERRFTQKGDCSLHEKRHLGIDTSRMRKKSTPN